MLATDSHSQILVSTELSNSVNVCTLHSYGDRVSLETAREQQIV